MSNDDRFISYLFALRREDVGTLAALRRACGHRLAESRGCHEFAYVSSRPVDFLIVTLAAQYSAETIKRVELNSSHGSGRTNWPFRHEGSIGAAWSRYCRERIKKDDPATFYSNRQADLAGGRPLATIPSSHERFRTVLDAQLDLDGGGELAYRLRGMVRMLVATSVPFDVIQLAHDLRCWRAESRYVQESWAKAFYAPPRERKPDKPSHLGNHDPAVRGDKEEENAN